MKKVFVLIMICLILMSAVPNLSAVEITVDFNQQLINHDQEITTMATNTNGLNVSVNVTDKNIKTVNLYYKQNNENDFSVARMKGKNGVFTGKVSGDKTSPPGFEYYFQVETANDIIQSPHYFVETEIDPIDAELLGVSAAGQTLIAHDLDYSSTLPNGKIIYSNVCNVSRTPTRDSSGNDSYPAVTSKLLEIRSTGSNPHRGCDLSVKLVNVYPVLDGVVDFVDSIGSGGAGKYMRIAHNGGDYFSHYYHLNSIGTNPSTQKMWAKGDTIAKTNILGVSGDTGTPGAYHLDFGLEANNGATRVVLPLKYFYSNRTAWNYARDLDYAGPPSSFSDLNGTGIQIRVYPKGTTNGSTSTVDLYARVSGTTSFTKLSMSSDPNDTSRYYAYLNTSTWKGKTVQYYVRVYRNGYTDGGNITRPMKWHESVYTGENNPGQYFSVYVPN